MTSAQSKAGAAPGGDPSGTAPATHEDAVDLIEHEFDATVITADGYDERHRALRREARKRKPRRSSR